MSPQDWAYSSGWLDGLAGILNPSKLDNNEYRAGRYQAETFLEDIVDNVSTAMQYS